MPERYNDNLENLRGAFPEQSERQKVVQELLEEHDSSNKEWNDLLAEESRLLSAGGNDIDGLYQIHERRVALIDRLWEIEKQIIKLNKASD